MSLQSTPLAERIQIGIFGKVNAGKSSVINALTGQRLAVVSDTPGTTTDPVKKAMELLPLGAVMLYDTPGLADDGALGGKRMEKTDEILRRIDMALVVVDASREAADGGTAERALLKSLRERALPFLVIANQTDRLAADAIEPTLRQLAQDLGVEIGEIAGFCAAEASADDRARLCDRIAAAFRRNDRAGAAKRQLVADLLDPGDMVVLVVPIDESAPKGRLILPQQQVLRDILDAHAMAVVTQPEELERTLAGLARPPRLVITDSQAFGRVAKLVPPDMPLTSFSVLMARYKGDLAWQAAGARTVDALADGARILISEGCTHHRQCGDIGTVKLPRWIAEHTGKEFDYRFTSGGEFPKDVTGFDFIVHCGGCTLPPQEMAFRIETAKAQGVPMTNYGTMIAYLHGILERAMAPLGEMA